MNENQWKLLNDEIKILNSLDSKNIIKLYNKFKTQKHFYMILEYCNGGNLEDLLKNYNTLSEEEASHIFKKVLMALRELKEMRVMHRDIKNSNILINFPSRG